MSDVMKYAAESGVGWVLLAVVLWYGGRWLGKWLTSAQRFQQKMVVLSAEQQRDSSAAWVAMLGEVEATNKEFADTLKETSEAARVNSDTQARLLENVVDALAAHEVNAGQRNEAVASLLKQLLSAP